MKYYYLHPGRPRYFFPEGFKQHPLFFSFCRPYAKKAAVSWWLFRHLAPYRWLFSKNDIESFVPEKQIRALIGQEALLAFNAGTPGPEQKTTALGWDGRNYFFLKYAQTPRAVENVKNEYSVLRKIADLDFVPHVLGFAETEQGVLLTTSIVRGCGVGSGVPSEKVLDVLQILADRPAENEPCRTDGLKYSFAHGDFCPWNMVEASGKILLYDWEMAGTYPAGYDLFTYIFQTSFLLSPLKSIEEILADNKLFIGQFFNHFGILDWEPYLSAFACIKVEYLTEQGREGLLGNYTKLLAGLGLRSDFKLNNVEGVMTEEPTDTRHESFLRPFFCALMDSGYPWSVLHSSDQLPYYASSDVDIVVAGVSPRDIENIILQTSRASGWRLVQMLWYDIPFGKYYVLKNEASGTYLAIDILHDPNGLGRYGFKTSRLIDSPHFNGLFNQTNGDVEFAYKLVKRIEKKYFTESDKSLFLNGFRTGDRNKILGLLSEQYGKNAAVRLLKKCLSEELLSNFSPKEFTHFKRQHFIRRKLLSLQFVRILFWQAVRLKNRLCEPCGMVVGIPSAREADAETVCRLLKNRLGLSFRSYTTAKSGDWLKIIKALITSRLCVVPCRLPDSSMKHTLRFHWCKRPLVLGCRAGEGSCLECSADDQTHRIDFLVIEIEKVLEERVRRRLHVGIDR